MSAGRGIVATAAAILIPVCAIVWGIGWIEAERIAAWSRGDLGERARSVNQLVEAQMRDGLERRVGRIADDAPFAAYVDASVGVDGLLDRESVLDLLGERREQYGLARLALLDPSGRPLVSTDGRLERRVDLGQHPAVRESIRQGRIGTGLLADEEGFDLIAVSPVVSGGSVVAHLLGSTRIDGQHAARLGQALGAPVALSSTAFGANPRLTLAPDDDASAWTARLSGPEAAGLLREPLFGDTTGPSLLVATDGPGAMAAAAIRRAGFVSALVAALGIGGALVWVWWRSLRPLGGLAAALRRIPAGDRHVELPVAGSAFARDILGALERLMVWLRSRP